jgi:hypothetical protein
MSDESSVAGLQGEELRCLQKFRARATRLAADYPDVSRQILFARAVEQMPKTLEKYLWIRQRLQFMGVAALPLR